MSNLGRPDLLEKLLEDIVDELDVPQSRYEAADRAYTSVGEWLERPDSTLRHLKPVVHVQGSFALGLAIKPCSDEDEYDVDAVCELSGSKAFITQHALKEALGSELHLYARAHDMNNAPTRKNRCWTLRYAEEAQFHLDALPALRDGAAAVKTYENLQLANPYAVTAIAITDERHPQFREITARWQRSNPRGYADWFRFRQRTVFEDRRLRVAHKLHAKVDQIPDHEVKTPLQAAIQILKRHRDIWGVNTADVKPISIILTTLAAHAYQQEVTISDALTGILGNMDRYIVRKQGIAWIANPSDPLENFADKWVLDSELEAGFYAWLSAARRDFAAIASAVGDEQLIGLLAVSLGDRLVRVAAKKRVAPSGMLVRVSSALRSIFAAPHRQPPPWVKFISGWVRITEVTVTTRGFRPKQIESDGPALSKNSSITFSASTNVLGSFRVYWQVVNTGREALDNKCLRGGFDEQPPQRGQLTKTESTFYSGCHSIECFIVKDGKLVARSEPFVVNIK